LSRGAQMSLTSPPKATSRWSIAFGRRACAENGNRRHRSRPTRSSRPFSPSSGHPLNASGPPHPRPSPRSRRPGLVHQPWARLAPWCGASAPACSLAGEARGPCPARRARVRAPHRVVRRRSPAASSPLTPRVGTPQTCGGVSRACHRAPAPTHRSSVEPPSAPPSLSRHSAAPRSSSSRRTPKVHQRLCRRAGSRAASTSSSFVAKVRPSSPDYPRLPPMHTSTSSSTLPPRRARCRARAARAGRRAARARRSCVSHVLFRMSSRVLFCAYRCVRVFSHVGSSRYRLRKSLFTRFNKIIFYIVHVESLINCLVVGY
jgi:hypothetical protein